MLRALLLILLCSGLPSLRGADSFYERELQQLTEQHGKAVAAAVLPINRNYQAALEQLLVRTTRNKDLEASAKVVAALRAIGAPAVAPAAPDAPPAAGAASKSQIEELLTSTVWVHRGKFQYKFTKDGHMSLLQENRKGRYQIDDKTGFVSFKWDGGLYPGEGLQFNAPTLSFTHKDGSPFVPVGK